MAMCAYGRGQFDEPIVGQLIKQYTFSSPLYANSEDDDALTGCTSRILLELSLPQGKFRNNTQPRLLPRTILSVTLACSPERRETYLINFSPARTNDYDLLPPSFRSCLFERPLGDRARASALDVGQ